MSKPPLPLAGKIDDIVQRITAVLERDTDLDSSRLESDIHLFELAISLTLGFILNLVANEFPPLLPFRNRKKALTREEIYALRDAMDQAVLCEDVRAKRDVVIAEIKNRLPDLFHDKTRVAEDIYLAVIETLEQ